MANSKIDYFCAWGGVQSDPAINLFFAAAVVIVAPKPKALILPAPAPPRPAASISDA